MMTHTEIEVLSISLIRAAHLKDVEVMQVVMQAMTKNELIHAAVYIAGIAAGMNVEICNSQGIDPTQALLAMREMAMVELMKERTSGQN